MKLHYYPETDSLYIELKTTPGTETREIAEGLVVDFDEHGDVAPRARTALAQPFRRAMASFRFIGQNITRQSGPP